MLVCVNVLWLAGAYLDLKGFEKFYGVYKVERVLWREFN